MVQQQQKIITDVKTSDKSFNIHDLSSGQQEKHWISTTKTIIKDNT